MVRFNKLTSTGGDNPKTIHYKIWSTRVVRRKKITQNPKPNTPKTHSLTQVPNNGQRTNRLLVFFLSCLSYKTQEEKHPLWLLFSCTAHTAFFFFFLHFGVSVAKPPFYIVWSRSKKNSETNVEKESKSKLKANTNYQVPLLQGKKRFQN